MAWISCLHSRLYKNANGRSFEYVWPVIQRRRAFARPRSASRGHIRVRVLCMCVVLWTVLKEKKKKKKNTCGRRRPERELMRRRCVAYKDVNRLTLFSDASSSLLTSLLFFFSSFVLSSSFCTFIRSVPSFLDG